MYISCVAVFSGCVPATGEGGRERSGEGGIGGGGGRGRRKGGGRERISGEGIGSFKENLLVNSEP